jgi:hypothetical protein
VLTPDFDTLTIQLTEEVRELLSRPWRRLWHRPNDPELRKNLGRLHMAFDQQLIAAGDQLFLGSLLEAEYQRDQGEEARLVVTWSGMDYAKPRSRAGR